MSLSTSSGNENIGFSYQRIPDLGLWLDPLTIGHSDGYQIQNGDWQDVTGHTIAILDPDSNHDSVPTLKNRNNRWMVQFFDDAGILVSGASDFHGGAPTLYFVAEPTSSGIDTSFCGFNTTGEQDTWLNSGQTSGTLRGFTQGNTDTTGFPNFPAVSPTSGRHIYCLKARPGRFECLIDNVSQGIITESSPGVPIAVVFDEMVLGHDVVETGLANAYFGDVLLWGRNTTALEDLSICQKLREDWGTP